MNYHPKFTTRSKLTDTKLVRFTGTKCIESAARTFGGIKTLN